MSTTTMCPIPTKEAVPEEPPVYTDLSQQFVLFEESDQSITPPSAVEENQSEEQAETLYGDEVNPSHTSDYYSNVVECVMEEPEEVRMVDGKSKGSIQKARQLRKRNVRRGGGNGLCPPHPPEDVPVVNWTEPNEIKHIFPKTYNYVVYAQARYSSQYLNLSKWRKEFDFFLDKYKYWCDIIQRRQLSNHKEITKAKQLVGQLRWLLDHCWEGDESKPLVPEMLWRARKEEARRCEQLLIRKEYYKREVLVKSAATSLSRRTNASTQKSFGEYKDDRSCSFKDSTKKSSSGFQKKKDQAGIAGAVVGLQKIPLSDKIKKEQEEQDNDALNFWKERGQIVRKRAHLFSLQFLVRRWAKVLKQLQTPSSIVRSLSHLIIVRNRLEKYVQDLAAAYETIKDSNDLDEQMIHVLLRRDALLKREMRSSGLGSLTNGWVIFESKSPKVLKRKLGKKMGSLEVSKSPGEFSSSNTSSTLLKVRDYLDDDGKSASVPTANSRTEHITCNSSKVTTITELDDTKNTEINVSERSGLTIEAEIPRPVAIKPSNLTEDEKNRLELQEVVAVEALWAAFAKTETPKCKNFSCYFKDDKPILAAIEAVLNSCRSYRAVLEVPLPKTLADLRRGLKFRNIQEAVGLLQTLIIERHEAKTVPSSRTVHPIIQDTCSENVGRSVGRRVDLTPFETPEIRRLRAQFTASAAVPKLNAAVSLETADAPGSAVLKSGVELGIDIKREVDELALKKKQKQEDDGVAESSAKELAKGKKPKENEEKIEMLATNRPKRHIKAPHRFIFDDEEREEEKKKKKIARARTKTGKGQKIEKALEKVKETVPENNESKEKSDKKTDLLSSPMEISNMETIVVIPEDDIVNENDCNCWSSNGDDEMFLGLDLIDVSATHEFKCEADGTVHDMLRYIATLKNGTAMEVSRRMYELWTTRKEIAYKTRQQREISSEVMQKEQVPSTNLLMHPDSAGSSNDEVINRDNLSGIHSSDSVIQPLPTGPCSSRNIAFGGAAGEQNESGDCGPWRQVAFRKDASLSGPAKMDKLKTQYDHLLMISEKSYVGKLLAEWMYVPEGGPFDDRVKRIRQFVQELEDVLNHPNSTWRDYFNMKKYLQTLIDNIMVDFSALTGQASSNCHLPSSNITFSSSRSTVSDVERDNADVSIRPNSN
uniref:Uncharacterized protein n=1 Tax=Setaria digitata TaxID=48799 RepID=A0A915Q0I8_9BILA